MAHLLLCQDAVSRPPPPPHLSERELLLLKLRVQPGPSRAEVLELAQIFRARVVDVSDNTLSLSVTGDPGKVGPVRKGGGRPAANTRKFSYKQAEQTG